MMNLFLATGADENFSVMKAMVAVAAAVAAAAAGKRGVSVGCIKCSVVMAVRDIVCANEDLKRV